ncbi:MAG: tRNA 2-thiouridine(34) synthase MnmA [Verrucomicrobia bacterium]|jgi:tRNA-uridine 2-sulfurtransferase|nr:tRNA 2-thiouridine(34) synthase MnmA [Verrucomicrobiota bacterium]MBT7067030.1 tRNA 2-thiouridine(34) synthase MnmA [Verrucomicrobiota bacterium]MBT7700835.1 tRNA 2-thiouridine(34) synthase MnmA [Verrucomicrobiota bacterium]
MALPGQRIAVGMSGGTDSSVAAAMLVEQGYDVLGLTARMWKEGSRCCSLEAVQSARKVCWHLGIRHVVVNAMDTFTRCVADRFAAEYVRGRTPSPCVACNQTVKFGTLLTRAVAFGCDALATGHYARRVEAADGWHLHCGRDASRDQSYFLHRLSQRQLAHARFPLGEMIKQSDVVPYAQAQRLPIATKEESRDICFAAPGQHHKVVERFFPGAATPGDIVDMEGHTVGRHAGIHRCTVGQRRGLGLSGGPPRYVVRIESRQNRVVVGSRDEAMAQTCLIEDPRWISAQPPPAGRDYRVALRYQHGPAAARIEPRSDGRWKIEFESPQFAVAPGQAAVIYSGDEVMGGGWIAHNRDEDDHATDP